MDRFELRKLQEVNVREENCNDPGMPLYMAENRFAIHQAERTRLLQLSNRGYLTIPPRVFELRELQRLDVSFNRLQNLPEEISGLHHLAELLLSYNPLRNLPSSIADCTKLTVSE